MGGNPVADPASPPIPSVLLLVDVQRDFMDDGPVPVSGAYAMLPAINALLGRKGELFDAAVATRDSHPPEHISFVTTHNPSWTESSEAGGSGGKGVDGGSPGEGARASAGGTATDGRAQESRGYNLLDTVEQEERLDPAMPKPAVFLFRPHCVRGTRGAGFADGLEAAHIDSAFDKGEHPGAESFSGFFDLGRTRDTGLAAYLHARKAKVLTVVGVATDYCVRHTVLDALAEGFKVLVVLDGVRGVEPVASEGALQEMESAGARLVHVVPSQAALGSSALEPALEEALRA